MTEQAEYIIVTFLCCFISVQALILKELDIVDPEYIGTICGSYRRGNILEWKCYKTIIDG